MILNLVFFVIGLLLLYFGAEWLVKGSSSLARSLGLTPIVIGLTVVAFGTSAPELVVSLISSIQGKSMIAVGNIVGSNICNIALVLGLAAIFMPITCDKSVVKRDIPIMLGISLYLFIISLNSQLGRFEGTTLFAGVILYTIFNYSIARKTASTGPGLGGENLPLAYGAEEIEYIYSRTKQIALILAGIAGVIIGAELLIDSAVSIMKVFGVSEKFIGLTMVAFGTSLPELATSVVAALRKEMDISIGNLVGSNVFNILSVLGMASIVRPIPIPGGFIESGLIFDYIVMIIISLLPLLMMRKTYTVTRKHGFILLSCYVGYLAYLIIKS
ncbi:MAG: calcium/sodium antiporter [Deltaproteobacteria bacterium]|nr:calcium/sodium antiporter [Deltaproteobacteria bacterium]MBW2139822.1 calcium/sodium antiporter [Deltaproteobacteria bacterium]MBW2322172.1 calcium/sodium antiporter [Deltaproteobacteria bacterium]